MAMPKFSADLFEQMGGTSWVARPGYFENRADPHRAAGVNAEESQESSDAESFALDSSEASVESSPEFSAAVEKSPVQEQESIGLVLVGSGLNSIWEDDSRQEWQLWLNICEALGWQEEQVAYYDTDALISEEMLFSTMEEIVESGVERVLSMQPDSELSEQLSEGLQVVEVPTLHDMLVDPYAKQSFYQSVMVARSPV